MPRPCPFECPRRLGHRLSFKHTVQARVAWSQRRFLSAAPEDTAALFRLIAHIRVGNRPGRMEPRLIKTRPKPFARLQTRVAEHAQTSRNLGVLSSSRLNSAAFPYSLTMSGAKTSTFRPAKWYVQRPWQNDLVGKFDPSVAR